MKCYLQRGLTLRKSVVDLELLMAILSNLKNKLGNSINGSNFSPFSLTREKIQIIVNMTLQFTNSCMILLVFFAVFELFRQWNMGVH